MDLTLVWHAFPEIDVGVVFSPLIDVGVAILATGTQISRNPATRTSISWKAGHGNANPGESRHTDVDLEERLHANAKPKEPDMWTQPRWRSGNAKSLTYAHRFWIYPFL